MQSRTRSSRLPASRAFVVHLLDEADPALGRYPGRVEHVTSGETCRFNNVATLLAFFREMFDRDERGRSATPVKPNQQENPK